MLNVYDLGLDSSIRIKHKTYWIRKKKFGWTSSKLKPSVHKQIKN